MLVCWCWMEKWIGTFVLICMLVLSLLLLVIWCIIFNFHTSYFIVQFSYFRFLKTSMHFFEISGHHVLRIRGKKSNHVKPKRGKNKIHEWDFRGKNIIHVCLIRYCSLFSINPVTHWQYVEKLFTSSIDYVVNTLSTFYHFVISI